MDKTMSDRQHLTSEEGEKRMEERFYIFDHTDLSVTSTFTA
jgi:hypothetical protein